MVQQGTGAPGATGPAIRKLLETADIVGAVLFLSSELSQLTTGQTLMVYGRTMAER